MEPLQKRFLLILILVFLVINLGLVYNLFKDKYPQIKNSYPEIAEIQKQNFSSYNQFKDYFQNLAIKKGGKYAYNILKIAPIPAGVDLHLLGHVVGDVLYQQIGAKGIEVCTQDFRNACSHTIVIGLFMDKGEQALGEITNICKQAPGGAGAYNLCFHGLGHGVLAYAGYDLEKAIALCQKTSPKTAKNKRESGECIGGAVMEIVGGGFHDPELWKKQSAKYLSSKNPLEPCTSSFMPKEGITNCLIYLTPHLLKVAGKIDNPPPDDVIKKAFIYCEPLKDKALLNVCMGGFGKEFVVFASNYDVRNVENMTGEQLTKIYNWCNLAPNQDSLKSCINYAVGSVYWGGENRVEGAINFCNVVPKEGLRSFCFKSLTNIVKQFDENKLANFCNKLSEEDRKTCPS